jgi:hypothetical protein
LQRLNNRPAFRASHARRLHQRRSAVRCILVVHGAGGADQPVGPAAETLLSNGDAVCLCVCVCASPGCIPVTQHTGATTNPRHLPPKHSWRLSSLKDTSGCLSVHPESHDWSPGPLAPRMSRRLPQPTVLATGDATAARQSVLFCLVALRETCDAPASCPYLPSYLAASWKTSSLALVSICALYSG